MGATRDAAGARDGAGWRDELRRQLRLALPVILIQLGLSLMGTMDGLFLGRVDATQFAATAIGNAYSFLCLSFGMGFLTLLDPVVSQAHGAGDEGAIRRNVQRAGVLALALSAVTGLVLWPVDAVLPLVGIEPEVVAVATRYTRITIASVPAFLLFIVLRQTLQALHRLRDLLAAVFWTNLLNVLLDWALIWGRLGFEPMGAAGAAWATVIARWAMLLLLLLLARERVGAYLWRASERLWERGAYLRMARVGAPAGLQWFLEISAFASVAALMGRVGTVELAAHQVAISLASTSFMVPLGISMAGSVRVGNAIGRGDLVGMRRASRVAVLAGVGTMAVFGLLFLSFPWQFARLFTDLEAVLALAAALVPLAGMFQVFDGAQVVAVGVLRGMGDTRVPMLLHGLGFWAFALPLGYWLAFPLGQGAMGLWIGLALGLCAVACVQFLRLRVMLGRDIGRLVIED